MHAARQLFRSFLDRKNLTESSVANDHRAPLITRSRMDASKILVCVREMKVFCYENPHSVLKSAHQSRILV